MVHKVAKFESVIGGFLSEGSRPDEANDFYQFT
jgi:hypothetical protein